jgi:tRNA (guanine-N7-)-methyltransferase
MRDVLPKLEITAAAATDPVALFPTQREVRLEIGFGAGEHLLHHLRTRPEAGFIGCEPFRNGVAKLVEQASADIASRLRVFVGDAGELIDRLPDASLTGVDLFYPDPWPKRRQRKRRFVSDDTLRRLARVTADGAPLRFATDIDDYAGWTLARVLRSFDWSWDAVCSSDWTNPWPGWPSTRYEQKALREGRRPVYLTFRRRPRDLP